MLQVPSSPVPSISISFAPNELPPSEPQSPFVVQAPEALNSPRPQHLMPPPILSPSQVSKLERQQLSPLNPAGGGKGLERDRFESLLKAARERSVMLGAKKQLDLRKELAVKVQTTKQMERRARFLSKIAQPPSPSAAQTPATPPESPAVFHYSLPSPGLKSPIDVFEDVVSHPERYPRHQRIEQVDFRLPYPVKKTQPAPRETIMWTPAKHLPSLDEITERLAKSPGSLRFTHPSSPVPDSTKKSRLPSFLRARTPSFETEGRTISASSGHMKFLPKRDLDHAIKPTRENQLRVAATVKEKESVALAFPPSPQFHRVGKLQIITTICPPTVSKGSPTKFTEKNITQFASQPPTVTLPPMANAGPVPISYREQVTRDLFAKLGRRTSTFPGAFPSGSKAHDDLSSKLSPRSLQFQETHRRRTSAPAELSPREATHPILERPGAF